MAPEPADHRALTDCRDRFYSRIMESLLEKMSESGAEAAALPESVVRRRRGAGLGLRNLENQIDSLIEERDRLREEKRSASGIGRILSRASAPG